MAVEAAREQKLTLFAFGFDKVGSTWRGKEKYGWSSYTAEFNDDQKLLKVSKTALCGCFGSSVETLPYRQLPRVEYDYFGGEYGANAGQFRGPYTTCASVV
eukprot:Sspe_Gene.66792::Locus_39462_Transcript_1_1_Confidence_1.000_Length_1111::g.66792::m.66792